MKMWFKGFLMEKSERKKQYLVGKKRSNSTSAVTCCVLTFLSRHWGVGVCMSVGGSGEVPPPPSAGVPEHGSLWSRSESVTVWAAAVSTAAPSAWYRAQHLVGVHFKSLNVTPALGEAGKGLLVVAGSAAQAAERGA